LEGEGVPCISLGRKTHILIRKGKKGGGQHHNKKKGGGKEKKYCERPSGVVEGEKSLGNTILPGKKKGKKSQLPNIPFITGKRGGERNTFILKNCGRREFSVTFLFNC